jgi:predicted nucleic acid-binding protein
MSRKQEPEPPPEIVLLDATVHLNFARVERLDLLARVNARLHASPLVLDELRHWPKGTTRAMQPLDLRAELGGSLVITQMATHEELGLFADLRERLGLGRGESECFAIARARSWRVATDDGRARTLLARHGIAIDLTGTIAFVEQLASAGVVERPAATQLVALMKSRGGRLP